MKEVCGNQQKKSPIQGSKGLNDAVFNKIAYAIFDAHKHVQLQGGADPIELPGFPSPQESFELFPLASRTLSPRLQIDCRVVFYTLTLREFLWHLMHDDVQVQVRMLRPLS